MLINKRLEDRLEVNTYSASWQTFEATRDILIWFQVTEIFKHSTALNRHKIIFNIAAIECSWWIPTLTAFTTYGVSSSWGFYSWLLVAEVYGYNNNHVRCVWI